MAAQESEAVMIPVAISLPALRGIVGAAAHPARLTLTKRCPDGRAIIVSCPTTDLVDLCDRREVITTLQRAARNGMMHVRFGTHHDFLYGD